MMHIIFFLLLWLQMNSSGSSVHTNKNMRHENGPHLGPGKRDELTQPQSLQSLSMSEIMNNLHSADFEKILYSGYDCRNLYKTDTSDVPIKMKINKYFAYINFLQQLQNPNISIHDKLKIVEINNLLDLNTDMDMDMKMEMDMDMDTNKNASKSKYEYNIMAGGLMKDFDFDIDNETDTKPNTKTKTAL